MGGGFKVPLIWRGKGSHGPDVEAVLLIPLVVAVESKPSVTTALNQIGQILRYKESGVYDSVILRLQGEPRDKKDLDILKRYANENGVGIVIGKGPHDPPGRDKVILPAKLDFKGNPYKFFTENRVSFREDITEEQDLADALKHLVANRKYFRVV